MVRLRVTKSTSPVEPSGSKRLIIGRNRSRRFPTWRDDGVPDLLGCENTRLGDSHQVAEAVAAGQDNLLLDPCRQSLTSFGNSQGRLSSTVLKRASRIRLARAKATCCARYGSDRPPQFPLADNAAHLDPPWDGIRANFEDRCLVKVEPDVFVRQLNAIAVELREPDAEIFSAFDSFDVDGWLRRFRVGDRLVAGDELKRDSVNICVFGLEEASLLVDRVRAAAQASADDLLTEKL